MNYYDDILNVNAYLREKMRKNMRSADKLARRMQQQRQEYARLSDEIDDLLLRAERLTQSMGITVSEQETEAACTGIKRRFYDCSELLVEIPDDYDFAEAFEKLRREAHEAGFVDVHPEELLSAEEMQRAERFSDELDARFKRESGLTNRDFFVLTVSIALRVMCRYMLDKPKEQAGAAGKPIDSLKAGAKEISSMISMGNEIAANLSAGEWITAAIKPEAAILCDAIPFDIPDNELFTHRDVLGYNRWMGWFFGVINIMTDTVTTRRMNSYSVIRSAEKMMLPQIYRKISTPVQLMQPVLENISEYKEELLAAVVREAEVLKIGKNAEQAASQMLYRTMQNEQRSLDQIKRVRDAVEILPMKINIGETLKDMAVITFLDQLIAAIHAVMYDPERDGKVEMYAIRTNKILAISSAVSAMLDSIPALLEQDMSKLNWSEIVGACMNIFSSSRFWIEIKTEYLLSAHKAEVDKRMAEIDKYFKVLPSEENA